MQHYLITKPAKTYVVRRGKLPELRDEVWHRQAKAMQVRRQRLLRQKLREQGYHIPALTR